MKKYDEFLNESVATETAKIIEIVKNKTEYKVGDIPFFRGDNRIERYITGLPRKRKSLTENNMAMDRIDNSPRWKDFPKRSKSLTFLQNIPNFGKEQYQVIPFKGVKIAYSTNGDFNYSFINEHIENIFFDDYDVGLNDNYGDGYSPNTIIDSMLFDYEMLNFKDDINLRHKTIENELINNELSFERFSELYTHSGENSLHKMKNYSEILKKTKRIKEEYFKSLNKKYNNYEEFIDFLLDPYLNGFKLLSYKEAMEIFPSNNRSEFWIDGEFIMLNKSNARFDNNFILSK